MKRIFRYTIIIFFTFCSFNLWSQESCTQNLREARSLYEEGKLSSLTDLLKPCIQNGFSKEEKIEALRLVTLAHLYSEDEESAKVSYMQLLKVNPEYKPNPQADPSEYLLLSEKFDTDPKFFYGINAGAAYTLVNVKNSTADVVVDLNQGNYGFSNAFGFGLFFQYPINPKISINAEVDFTIRSLSLIKEPVEGSTTDAHLISEDSQWLDFPLLVNYQLPIKSFPLELTGGPVLHYAILTEVTSEGTGNNFNDVDFLALRNEFNLSAMVGLRASFKVLGKGYLTTAILYQHRFLDEVSNDGSDQEQLNRLFDSAYYDGNFAAHNIWLQVGVKFPFYNPKLK